jgi:hypothetical protein
VIVGAIKYAISADKQDVLSFSDHPKLIGAAHAAEQTIARLHSKLICHATPVELRGNNVRRAGEFRWTMQTAARPGLVPQPLTN